MNTFPRRKIGFSAGLSALFFVLSSATIHAQTPPSGPEGNWQVDWIGSTYEHTPDSARISLYRARTNLCDDLEMSGCVFADTIAENGDWSIEVFDGDKSIGVQNFNVDAASGSIGIRHFYHVFDYWGGTENAQLTGPNTIQGDWTGNYEAGKTRWSRIVPNFVALNARNVEAWTHVIDQSSAASNRIEITMPWTVEHWAETQNFPHLRPQFILQVQGDNLWGRHFAGFPDSKGIEVRRVTNASNANGDGALDVEIKLWPGVRPGRHTLVLDGQEIEIDLTIPGFPEDPDDMTIGPLRFTGLQKLSHPQTEALRFLGLRSIRHVESEPLKFAGLQNTRHLEIGGLQFEGYGETDRIVLRESMRFEGWRADLAPMTTKAVQFTGWAAPETAKTDPLYFEGWRWDSSSISTDTLKFTGHGRD